VLGIAVAAWGHYRIGQGMRRYGAAMIGAGGGLVYLGLWAAAGPYALMERRVGILLLALTTVVGDDARAAPRDRRPRDLGAEWRVPRAADPRDVP